VYRLQQYMIIRTDKYVILKSHLLGALQDFFVAVCLMDGERLRVEQHRGTDTGPAVRLTYIFNSMERSPS
jgi:hypothetical protein